MIKWTKKLEDINPDKLDTPFTLQSDSADHSSSQINAFIAVIEEPAPGSEPFPDRLDRYLIGFSNFCTHMGCRLAKEGTKLDRDKITGALVCGPCPCHGTEFNLSKGGVVILGPASQHLPQLTLSVSDDKSEVIGAFPSGNDDPTEEQWPNGLRS